ncbi:MAG: hypothetical protein JO222_09395 [Frankiales bacterium]|nr:hypothetical protein [Frankiales bacterium]
MLQLDEPSLPAVLAGAVRTASGLGRVPAVDPTVVAAALRDVVAAAGDDVPVAVHCCAADVPLGVIQDAGAAVASFALDVAVLDPAEVAERVERGLGLWVGIVPSSGPGVAPAVREVADPLRRFFHRIGLSLESLVAATTVTPTCGLGAASDGWARTALGLVRRTARVLAEAPEVVAG